MVDKETYLLMDEKVREVEMRKELGEEKCKLLDRFDLHANNRLYWERRQEKYPNQEYFSHKMAVKTSVIGIIFHINRLCYAKTKYFEKNWEKFEACYYNTNEGFVKCNTWEMDFIRQKSTGIVLDLRELAKIHWVEEFHKLCRFLEKKDRETFCNVLTLKKVNS